MHLEIDIPYKDFENIKDLYELLCETNSSHPALSILSKIIESLKLEDFAFGERNNTIYKMHNKGLSYKEIGKIFNLRPSTVQQICWKQGTIKNRLNNCNDTIPFLKCVMIAAKELHMPNTRSTRVYNTLYRNGLIDFNEKVKNLDEIPDIKFIKMKDIGPKSLILIRRAYEIYKDKNV